MVLLCAALQSLAGLNPFYFASKGDGHGFVLRRTQSGENATSFICLQTPDFLAQLADAVQSMQRDLGATLIITDSPETASALSFYLPHNPFVYVDGRSV